MERALGQGAVIVRAAVLHRIDRAVAVEDADVEVLPLDHAYGSGWQFVEPADVDELGHGR